MDPTTKIVGYFTAVSLISAALVVIVKNVREFFAEVSQTKLFQRLEPKLTQVANMDLGAIKELAPNGGESVKDKINKVDERSQQRAIDTQELLKLARSQGTRIESLEKSQQETRNEQNRVKDELVAEQKKAREDQFVENGKIRESLQATSRDLLEHREMMARYIIHEANGSLNYSKLRDDEQRLLQEIADKKQVAEARAAREAELNEPPSGD